MELDLKTIEKLMQLMVDKKLDSLQLGDFHLTKSRHETAKAEATQANKPTFMDDEEILYYSTSSPSLTLEQLQGLAANPMPIPETSIKRVRKGKVTNGD